MGDLSSDDYYAVLGVSREATDQEISKAYKRAAIKWHPDKNPGDAKAEDNFKKVAEAYDCLSNADKRAAYDRFGKEGLKANGCGHPGGGFNHAQAEQIFKTFFGGQDPFDMFMGGGARGGPFQFGGVPGGMPGGPQMFFQGAGGPGGFGAFPGGFPGAFNGAGMGGIPRGGPGAGRARRPGPNELPRGARVVLRGLKSAAHQNGKRGAVAAFDPERERYTVQLEDGDHLSVRPSNLTQLLQVTLTDMRRAQELNGQSATIVGYDDEMDRYVLQLADGRAVAAFPGNVVLPDGSVVTVAGLESEAGSAHNGKRGRLVSYDAQAGRYQVQLSGTQHLRLRRDCVRA